MDLTENAPGAENTRAVIELEQGDEYSQYLLHSKSEILSVLRSLLQKAVMVTVHFDQGRSFFLTTLLSVNPNASEFAIDIGGDEEMNRRALSADRLILTTSVDKVKVQFRTGRLRKTNIEGRPAFVSAVPDAVLRLQRREYFRLSTPIANPIKLHALARREDNTVVHLDLPLLDISGGGLGLMASTEHARLLERGIILDECKLTLPEEGLVVMSLCVRNKFDVTTRTGARFVRIGCEYVNLPAGRLSMVQRYITRMERERKARIAGLA